MHYYSLKINEKKETEKTIEEKKPNKTKTNEQAKQANYNKN